MKILIAAMSLDIGGAETHVAELARELLRRGHDVTIVSAGGIYVEGLSQAGVKHYFAPLNTRRPRDMAQALGSLSFLVKAEKFDVVHAHARIPAFLCGLLRRRYRFNFVTTAHWVFSSKGMEKRLTNWGDRTLAVSEDIRTYLLEKYSVPERNITVTVNGIDTERFSPGVSGKNIRRELEIPVKAPVLVSVARLDKTESAPTKMVSALLDSAVELNTLVPGLIIVVAGGGDDEFHYFDRASRINMELGRNMVIMTGARTDINEVLAAGDLFVGVSRAAMEAMSTGLPVILAGSEGYLGLFNDDKLPRAVATNFTCRGEGETLPDSLCADIAEFFTDFGKPVYEGRSAKLGAFGRDTIVKMYSVLRMADDCIRVYESFGGASQKGRGKRVVMSGYYGFGNAGDEAIMQAVYDCIAAERPDTEITVLSKNPKITTAQYGYRAVSRFNPFRVLHELRRSDALAFGGGSLLQDYTSSRSLLYYLAIIRLARWLRCPVMIYANGIGPVTREKNRRRVKNAVMSAAVVTLRDERSLEELRAMGVTREDIIVTGDPVYTMTLPDEPSCREICAKAGIDTARPFVVVSVRNHISSERLFSELSRLCDMISETLGCDIVFLPMQREGDLDASEKVAGQMSAKSLVLSHEYTARELLGILHEARFAVSMRLHTLIIAARAGTPSAGIVVDPKIIANLELLGMPDIGTPEELRADAALETARGLFERRDELSERLRELSARHGERAQEDARLLNRLLER